MRAYIHVSWLDPCKVRRVTIVGSEKMVVYNDLAGRPEDPHLRRRRRRRRQRRPRVRRAGQVPPGRHRLAARHAAGTARRASRRTCSIASVPGPCRAPTGTAVWRSRACSKPPNDALHTGNEVSLETAPVDRHHDRPAPEAHLHPGAGAVARLASNRIALARSAPFCGRPGWGILTSVSGPPASARGEQRMGAAPRRRQRTGLAVVSIGLLALGVVLRVPGRRDLTGAPPKRPRLR